ncbi:MAG: YdgA family protein, partial [Treponema sp.]|nr:YdgA family protein [Treponema sp.]
MKKIVRVVIAVVLCAAIVTACATSGGGKNTAKSQIVLVNEAGDRSVTIKYRSGKETKINLKKDVPVSITVPSG